MTLPMLGWHLVYTLHVMVKGFAVHADSFGPVVGARTCELPVRVTYKVACCAFSGPECSFAMGILLAVFIGLLVMAVVLGWMHARKERKRNEMVALSGFADD